MAALRGGAVSYERGAQVGAFPWVRICLYRVSSSILGPVDPSFRVLSGRLKFTVRRQNFNEDSLLLFVNKYCCFLQAQCGNGLVEAGEVCDDGNALFADGCDILCQVRFHLE